MSWKPIETAPKDGTEILLYEPGPAYVQMGYWVRDGWLMVDAQCGGESSATPTHWLPIPEPPV